MGVFSTFSKRSQICRIWSPLQNLDWRYFWPHFEKQDGRHGYFFVSHEKLLISPLLLVLEVLDGKPTYRKSWDGNLLVWSDLTLDPSFKVKRGEPNLKVLISHLLLVLEVLDGKPTYRKSWDGNLLVWSDLILDPSFKVKRG